EGTLRAAPVRGGPDIVLGQNAQSNWAASGSKVVFSDNFVAAPPTQGTADIRVIDLAGGAPARLLVRQANAGFWLSPARDRVAYATESGAAPGLYSLTVP